MQDLFGKTIDFNNAFLTSQLITYLGNKRALLPFINQGIEYVKERLKKSKIFALDGFAGSGVVSRLLKYHCHTLHTNDIEHYAYLINTCYLANKSTVDIQALSEHLYTLNHLDEKDLYAGFITQHYAPKDDNHINAGERVFYTHHNALLIDTMHRYIFDKTPENLHPFLFSPLLVQASIHTNTSGVFKGFHKKDGKGHFGGKGENCLERIKGDIYLPMPLFCEEECAVRVFQKDINVLIKQPNQHGYDLAYFDPPYNQHPYGSNYFMLNLIADKQDNPPIQNGVSGIAQNWYKSAYNKKVPAIEALDDLIKNTPAAFILISYNNEGIIPFPVFKQTLEKYGKVKLLEKNYNTYRGSRNLQQRNIKVKELLWIVEKD